MSALWTRAEHYREASILLAQDNNGCPHQCPHSGCRHEMATLRRAAAHAALAGAPLTVEEEAIEIQETLEARASPPQGPDPALAAVEAGIRLQHGGGPGV